MGPFIASARPFSVMRACAVADFCLRPAEFCRSGYGFVLITSGPSPSFVAACPHSLGVALAQQVCAWSYLAGRELFVAVCRPVRRFARQRAQDRGSNLPCEPRETITMGFAVCPPLWRKVGFAPESGHSCPICASPAKRKIRRFCLRTGSPIGALASRSSANIGTSPVRERSPRRRIEFCGGRGGPRG